MVIKSAFDSQPPHQVVSHLSQCILI